MSTEKQLEANRKNAQKSTGPKTAEGKGQSRLNALKHGLRADFMDVLPGECHEEFGQRLDAWHDEHRPATPTEDHLVRQAAILFLPFQRRIEAGAGGTPASQTRSLRHRSNPIRPRPRDKLARGACLAPATPIAPPGVPLPIFLVGPTLLSDDPLGSAHRPPGPRGKLAWEARLAPATHPARS